MSANLPEPDPAVGSAAHSTITEARRDIEGQLADGSLSMADLFQMVLNERTEAEASGQATPHRVVGHLKLRAALLAHDKIGEKKADEILEEVGLDGDRHLDDLGTEQQQQLVAAVAARQ